MPETRSVPPCPVPEPMPVVMPNNSPPPFDPLGSFFGALPPKDDPNLEPRKNLSFIANYAKAADMISGLLADAKRCGCKTCLLKVPALTLNLYVTEETLAAAYSGDTSKLTALSEFVEKQKAPAPNA